MEDMKMKNALMKFKSAYEELCSAMGMEGEDSDEMEEGGEMPDQEMDAEEGDYQGKGMMAADEKKKLLMAAMKKG